MQTLHCIALQRSQHKGERSSSINPMNIFQGRPRKRNPRTWKNIIFRDRLFWETEAKFGRLGNFPHILGMRGCVENCQTSQIWLQFLKTVSISDAAVNHRAGCASLSGPIDLKFWFKAKNWNSWPPYFLPFIILTNRYRVGNPPVVSSTMCHCVANRCRL